MKVIKLNTKVSLGEIQMNKNTAYVMSDPIAKDIAQKYKNYVSRFELFEPYYKPYIGHNLDYKSLILWRTGGFGDLLLITPIVEWLKHKYPTAKISVATSKRFRDVWKNNPNIDRFNSSYTLPVRLSFVKQHDYVGIFEGTIESSKLKDQYCAIDVFAFTLGIFDMPLEFKRPRYYLKREEINVAKNKVRSVTGFDIYKEPYICFQWKSSSLLRDYPYEKMIEVMYRLQELTGYKIVILTHPNYRAMIEHEIRLYNDFVSQWPKKLDYINLAGITSYRESAAVLALSAGLIGIDSSLAHLAAALAVPSVTIYGPFRAEWRTLYNQNNISLQNQQVCPNAPCAYHTQPGNQDGLPYIKCTDNNRFPQYIRDRFCRVMASVTEDDIVRAFETLWNLEKKNDLPLEREFPCKL